MRIPWGEPIGPREVEQLALAQFDALAATIVGEAAGESMGDWRIPRLSRPNVRDRGIDAEIDGTVASEGLAVPGWNVYQFKHRDPLTDRAAAVRDLRRARGGKAAPSFPTSTS